MAAPGGPAPGLAPGLGGLGPGVFAPQPHNPHHKREKPYPLTDEKDAFERWAESFRLLLDRSGRLQWTLIMDTQTRNQASLNLGLTPVQCYADQNEMWSLLHDACKYSDKALPIISHTAKNKAHPEFATMAWIEILKIFDPRDAASLIAKKSSLKNTINSFNGEWRSWLQSVLHRHSTLRDAGQLITERSLIKKIRKAVFRYACKARALRNDMW